MRGFTTPLKFQIIADGRRLPQVIPTYDVACECIAALRRSHPDALFVVDSIHDRDGIVKRSRGTRERGAL